MVKAIAQLWDQGLGSLEDAIQQLREIDDRYNLLWPEDDCNDGTLPFWSAVYEAIKPLEAVLEGLETVEAHVPKPSLTRR